MPSMHVSYTQRIIRAVAAPVAVARSLAFAGQYCLCCSSWLHNAVHLNRACCGEAWTDSRCTPSSPHDAGEQNTELPNSQTVCIRLNERANELETPKTQHL